MANTCEIYCRRHEDGGAMSDRHRAGKQPDQTHRGSVAAWTLPESHDFKDALTEHQERWVVLFL